MLAPFDYFGHLRACSRKQAARADIIATLPAQHYRGPLTAADRAVLDAPIAELVAGVQDGRTDARAVVRTYGKVAVRAHAKTNCLTEVMLPQAEEWAERGVNLKGPLAGLPVSLKDSINLAGYDSSVGYSGKTGKPFEEDGVLVKILKSAGAIPYVKTNLPISLLSFESTNDLWGRTGNPHNFKYSPGGSTGGEGALLALGGRIGVGSDVAGSVRAPAHFSGCYSIRCSTGRWPKSGVSTSMNGQEGVPSVFSPMARTLDDLIYFTKGIASMKPWRWDHTVHPIPWREDEEKEILDKKKLRIGVMWTDGVVDPSPACLRALQTTVDALRAAGHDIVDLTSTASSTAVDETTIPSPPSAATGLVLSATLLNSDGCATFLEPFRTGERNDAGAAQMVRWARLFPPLRWLHAAWVRYARGDALWAELLESFAGMSAARQWKWVARREAYKAEWMRWWNAVERQAWPHENAEGSDAAQAPMDFLLTPPNATPAVPEGGMHDAVSSCGYTFLFNLLDYSAGVLPVTHVDRELDRLPAGFDCGGMNGVARGAYKLYDAEAMHGLPVGVQVVGKRLTEEKVLAAMKRVEDALETHAGGKYELLEIE